MKIMVLKLATEYYVVRTLSDGFLAFFHIIGLRRSVTMVHW